MVNEILVPLDGTPESEAVLPAARVLARALPARITLASIVERPDIPPVRKGYLEERRRELSGENLEASAVLRVGRPAAEIADLARGRAATCIAMTTHGRRGVERLTLGSVAEEVVRHAPVPMLLVRSDAAALAGRRILVPLDGSAAAESVLPDAVRLSRALGWPIDLVRVELPILAPAGLGEPLMPIPGEDPMPYLQAIRSKASGEGAAGVRTVALEGRATTRILDHAHGAETGLICMTTHGRTGLARLVLGSIAEELIRTAPCPVWVRRNLNA
jgi:nucleotide-binding universal stress UspA family protein